MHPSYLGQAAHQGDWLMTAGLFFLGALWAQKFTFGGLELQKIVAYLFIDMIGDIPFRTTCEMSVRK